jgi:hypothetical protein
MVASPDDCKGRSAGRHGSESPVGVMAVLEGGDVAAVWYDAGGSFFRPSFGR